MDNHFASFELAQMDHSERLRKAAVCRLARQRQHNRSTIFTTLRVHLATTLIMLGQKLQGQPQVDLSYKSYRQALQR
jgi:hypothetical protein